MKINILYILFLIVISRYYRQLNNLVKKGSTASKPHTITRTVVHFYGFIPYHHIWEKFSNSIPKIDHGENIVTSSQYLKIALFALIFIIPILGHSQLKTPSLSPAAMIKQTVGITDITVEYSRPSAKGRTIFGEKGLLPYNEMWRTGANSATKLTISNTILINGHLLEKGSYTLISIPGITTWQLLWYPYSKRNWTSYRKQTPILTLELPVQKNTSYKETFEIHFQDITLQGASLLLEWEYTLLTIPIQVNDHEQIMTSIKKTLTGPAPIAYFNAAVYLHESKKDLHKALEYIQKVTASTDALFFQVTREAMILKDLDKNKEALTAAKRGLMLSEKANNKDFIRLNKKIIQEVKHP
ncbi:DUF2911 domain-containing protein [Aquimarina hainanensis]|uniref:DUF2911 domain-containing protein n=1 Tax=Aquimarina hainanensis TaxID=1578017 RepID=A0ABW5NA57_9FLAO|nr:DUF2911 domain-containing protein [Aquimarina sp. TRL1]QKX03480.1 DUF2911 domain-containing protein [Aquimarina sp. TRL1]